MIQLRLSYPPSVNAMYRNVPKVGRVKTGKYKDWQRDNEQTLALAYEELPKLEGHFGIEIRAYAPDRRKRDLDNIIKPILDLLVELDIVEDDSMCNIIIAAWLKDDKERGSVYITLVEDELWET